MSAFDATSERDRALWLAGLLEGEGYFATTDPGNGRRPQLKVVLNMCDGDVVRRAAEIVGSNAKVALRERPQPGWSPVYSVQWTGRDAERIMFMVLPFMGTRRSAAIVAALAEDCGHRHRRKTHCVRGHELAGANVRPRADGGRACRTCQRERSRRRRAAA